MKKHLGLVLCLALSLGLAPLAHGSGFLIYEHGAAAMGMAGAFVSIGSTTPRRFSITRRGCPCSTARTSPSAGRSSSPRAPWPCPTGPIPTYKNVKQADQTFLAPNFYLTHKFGKKIAAGIGVFAPYGLGTKWPEEYPLRYLGTSNEMQTIFINPSVSYLVNDNLSIGGGISYITSKLSLNLVRLRKISAPIDVRRPRVRRRDRRATPWRFNLGSALQGRGLLSRRSPGAAASISSTREDLALDLVNIPAPYKPYFPDDRRRQDDLQVP